MIHCQFPGLLPDGKRFHAFLTHNWGVNKENHIKVSKVHRALEKRGFILWFDEKEIKDQIRHQMSDGIKLSCAFLIFLTEIYEHKVNSGDMSDNCYYEFQAASNSKLVNYRLPIAMETKMLIPNNYQEGRLKSELGGSLIYDMTKDDEFENQVDELAGRLNDLLQRLNSTNLFVSTLPLSIPSCTKELIEENEVLKMNISSLERESARCKELIEENEVLKMNISSLERESARCKELIEEKEALKRKVSSLQCDFSRSLVTNKCFHLSSSERNILYELSSHSLTYACVQDYVAKWRVARPNGIVFKEVTAIIGPKGSGKSTYLWMKIPGFPKPVNCSGNGTNNLHILQAHGFMDTIGIEMEILSLIRLLVLFLVHDAVPMNAIFCENDRIERTLAILTHLGITKYYVLAMNVKYIHRYSNSTMSYAFNPDINAIAFDEDGYDAWHTRNNNCRRCDAETRIPINPLMNTFQDTLQLLFPLGRVDMVPYEAFVSTCKWDESKKTARELAYMVCRELKAFYEVYGQNEVAFMDQL